MIFSYNIISLYPTQLMKLCTLGEISVCFQTKSRRCWPTSSSPERIKTTTFKRVLILRELTVQGWQHLQHSWQDGTVRPVSQQDGRCLGLLPGQPQTRWSPVLHTCNLKNISWRVLFCLRAKTLLEYCKVLCGWAMPQYYWGTKCRSWWPEGLGKCMSFYIFRACSPDIYRFSHWNRPKASQAVR